MIRRDLSQFFVTARWTVACTQSPCRHGSGTLQLHQPTPESSQHRSLRPCAATEADGQLPTSAKSAYITISGKNCCSTSASEQIPDWH